MNTTLTRVARVATYGTLGLVGFAAVTGGSRRGALYLATSVALTALLSRSSLGQHLANQPQRTQLGTAYGRLHAA